MSLQPARASSHREAPSITSMPKVDGTDFYMFASYEPGREGYVTLIANYLPLQDPYGGPNYFSMDPDALYEIHIDNDGDAKEDLSFQFRFTNKLKGITLPIGGKNVAIPLKQAGQVSERNAAALNVNESFTLNVVRGNRRGGARGTEQTFDKPVDNIGTKTLPDYAGYAAKHVYTVNLPGFVRLDALELNQTGARHTVDGLAGRIRNKMEMKALAHGAIRFGSGCGWFGFGVPVTFRRLIAGVTGITGPSGDGAKKRPRWRQNRPILRRSQARFPHPVEKWGSLLPGPILSPACRQCLDQTNAGFMGTGPQGPQLRSAWRRPAVRPCGKRWVKYNPLHATLSTTTTILKILLL
jgi:hypothetical protein